MGLEGAHTQPNCGLSLTDRGQGEGKQGAAP